MSDKLWACFNKTCPCLPFRGESKPPFGYYSYDDDDNLEFENLLAGQDSESIAAFLTRAPFASSQGYRRVTNMVTPNEEASASTGRLLDDEDNLQTQDAQFLPDEQINKFTEQFIGEQVKYNQDNDEQLAQLAAEEEEAERLEEEEYERKRRAAAEAALAKGFITSDQAAAKNKNTYFTIDDDDGDDGQVTDSSRTVYSNGGSSVELSTTTSQRNAIEEQNTSLNKPRNPHERFVANDINEDDYDYDNVTDFEESPPTNSKDQTTIDDPLTRYSAAAIQDGAY